MLVAKAYSFFSDKMVKAYCFYMLSFFPADIYKNIVLSILIKKLCC